MLQNETFCVIFKHCASSLLKRVQYSENGVRKETWNDCCGDLKKTRRDTKERNFL